MAKDKICKQFVGIITPENKFTVDTIEDLKSRTYLALGDVVELNGYYEAGDGAHHKRKIEDADDGSGVQLANGLWANIVHNGEINVSWFGAKGDGVTDDSYFLNLAHKNENLIINYEKKIYIIDGCYSPDWVVQYQDFGGLFLNSNQVVNFNGSEIRLKQEYTGSRPSAIQSRGKHNIVLNSPHVVGYKYGQGGEWGHGILLWTSNPGGTDTASKEQYSKNIIINNAVLTGFQGDGLYLSGCFDILVDGLTVDSVRRNGLTINCGHDIRCINLKFKNIAGAAPESAIDIETDFDNGISNILIDGVEIFDCKNGVWCVTSSAKVSNIIVKNVIDYNVSTCLAYRYYNSQSIQEKDSNVIWENFTLMKIDTSSDTSGNSGVFWFQGSSKEKGTLCVKNLKIYDIVYLKSNTLISFGGTQTEKNYIEFECYSRTRNNYLLCYAKPQDESVIKTNFGTINNDESSNIVWNYVDPQLVDTFEARSCDTFLKSDNSPLFFRRFAGRKKVILMAESLSFTLQLSNPEIGYRFMDYTGKVWSGQIHNVNYSFEAEYFSTGDIIKITPIGFPKTSSLFSLDTPYYTTKMEEEGIYEDYVSYRDELHTYEQEQKLIEQQRQEAYQQALEENPDLSYEDWLSTQPMQMSIQVEPVPSKELIAFKEKYLG